ncbi:uncharacterized protein LOC134225088 [Armigeres subalbatus]|uniref:uncharacterized protein LOC134225088 n=1 Tax=Armigeres subalbatus TaxID=124917 RepID=UPI002ED0F031
MDDNSSISRLHPKCVEPVSLYPNVTRIMQPADVSAFKPLKNGWPKAVERFRKDNPLRRVTLPDFAVVLQDCLRHSLTSTSIKNGFRASGLFPWNHSAIDYSKCMTISAETEEDDVIEADDQPCTELNTTTDLEHAKALEQCAAIIGPTRAKKFRGDFIVLDNAEEEALFEIFRVLEETVPETIKAIENREEENTEIETEIIMDNNSSTLPAPIINVEGIDMPKIQQPTLKECLAPLPILERGTQREYKSKRYHVLTSDEFIEEFSRKEQEKKCLEEEKENRKKMREERKIANGLKKKQREEKKTLKKEKLCLLRKNGTLYYIYIY